jgi:DNA-binding transcriptional ArsR family regulator
MNINRIAQIGSLVGEPARTAMLVELTDGRALTASELARAARVTPQTASRHLALLVEAGLLNVSSQGRRRYHRLASPEVARLLENIMQIAALRCDATRPRIVTGPRDAALRAARTCYDHLAGRLGVAIADRLIDDGSMAFEGEAGYLTDKGIQSLANLGIASAAATQPSGASTRAHCRPCLDWSERRPHVAGKVGALLCAHCLEQVWVRRRTEARALEITPKGHTALRHWLGADLWQRITE